MEEYGEMFFLSSKNAVKLLFDTFIKKNPLSAFEILPYFAMSVINPKSKPDYATRMWVQLSKKLKPFNPDVVYDAAFAYWGDRTMFYMVDKVKAKKKIAWLHFDYSYPKRDDRTYEKYFSECDGIINVSTLVDDSLKAVFPQIAHKCHVIENIQSPTLINRMADEGESFTDTDFSGKRILTVGRIAPQKGYDLALIALEKLVKDGFDVRWYILGGGEEEDRLKLENEAKERGVGENLVFLGTTINPYRYMRDCDIYAQPSRFEGKPIAVEEAKILCKPILVSSYLSAPEQVKEGKLGRICVAEPDSIYENLKAMLSDPQLCDGYVSALEAEKKGNEEEFLKILPLIE
jgi:glycosyltransferase involved in cell wall biosynthesis